MVEIYWMVGCAHVACFIRGYQYWILRSRDAFRSAREYLCVFCLISYAKPGLLCGYVAMAAKGFPTLFWILEHSPEEGLVAIPYHDDARCFRDCGGLPLSFDALGQVIRARAFYLKRF